MHGRYGICVCVCAAHIWYICNPLNNCNNRLSPTYALTIYCMCVRSGRSQLARQQYELTLPVVRQPNAADCCLTMPGYQVTYAANKLC